MAIEYPHYDKLPEGVGYQNVACPTTDADPNSVRPTQHVPDSHNASQEFQVVSLETTSGALPANPAPYWNSGESATLKILEP